MRFYMLWIGCLLTAVASAQSDSLQIDHSIDTKYLEDQFYLGVSYDWLVSKPENMKQHSFSRSFFGGYQRDIPLNKARNIGLAAGVGLSYELLYINLKATPSDTGTLYDLVSIEKARIHKNYYEHYRVDFPIEFRWRTSTPYTHKFWRIYTGLRPSIAFVSGYKLNSSSQNYTLSLESLKEFQCGLYAAIGHNTWNIYVQYGLRPLFKDTYSQEGSSLESHMLNIGLIFYIL